MAEEIGYQERVVSPNENVWLTLVDGTSNILWNPSTGQTQSKKLKQMAMRFHVVENGRATVHAIDPPGETALFDASRSALAGVSKLVYRSSSWTAVFSKSYEFNSAMKWARMAFLDLTENGGWKSVEITGCAERNIRYISDGPMSKTPDAIGSYGGSPLIYSGKAIAVIFRLNDYDVLPNNVVYTLSQKMWEGFHDKKRKVHKDFPGPGRLGFVCSHWCQRFSHENYGSGIWLASMTQNHSLAGWAAGQMRNWWKERGEKIPGDDAMIMTDRKYKPMSEADKKLMAATAIASQMVGDGMGMIGTVCRKCNGRLTRPFGKCHLCGWNNPFSEYVAPPSYCTECGRRDSNCECNGGGNHIKISYDTGKKHYKGLVEKVEEVKSLWAKA